jgi:hypothetical protein
VINNFAWQQGFLKNKERSLVDAKQAGSLLKPGQYFYDREKEIFYANPKRALYGHTIFAVTKSNKFIIFKIFNKSTKDNGLYLEQLGPALAKVSQGILGKTGIKDSIIFAGVGANGGDPRTFLGLVDNPGFKNTPEDNLAIKLQEKLAMNSRKPAYLKVLMSP